MQVSSSVPPTQLHRTGQQSICPPSSRLHAAACRRAPSRPNGVLRRSSSSRRVWQIHSTKSASQPPEDEEDPFSALVQAVRTARGGHVTTAYQHAWRGLHPWSRGAPWTVGGLAEDDGSGTSSFPARPRAASLQCKEAGAAVDVQREDEVRFYPSGIEPCVGQCFGNTRSTVGTQAPPAPLPSAGGRVGR